MDYLRLLLTQWYAISTHPLRYLFIYQFPDIT